MSDSRPSVNSICEGRSNGCTSPEGITSIPTEGFTWTKKDVEKPPEILNRSEIRTLLREAQRLENPWFPVWALALFTGMRSGELYALRWDCVDLEREVLTVSLNWTNKSGFGPTKGRYWRTVPINNKEVLGLLRKLKLRSNGGPFVLPRFQSWKDGRQAEILRTFCEGIGIPSVRFHILRSCFATELLREGVAPAVVMKICGWKDLKTMQRYVHLASVEVRNATDGLRFMDLDEATGLVVNLFAGVPDPQST